MPSNILKLFGKQIRAIRKKRGFSQEELAFRSSLHRTYISDIERGSRNVSLLNIEKLAKALKVKMRELLD